MPLVMEKKQIHNLEHELRQAIIDLLNIVYEIVQANGISVTIGKTVYDPDNLPEVLRRIETISNFIQWDIEDIEEE